MHGIHLLVSALCNLTTLLLIGLAVTSIVVLLRVFAPDFNQPD
jgi:hypothetical protein